MKICIIGSGATALGLLIPELTKQQSSNLVTVVSRHKFAKNAHGQLHYELIEQQTRSTVTGFSIVGLDSMIDALVVSDIWITAVGRVNIKNLVPFLATAVLKHVPKALILCENIGLNDEVARECRLALPQLDVLSSVNFSVMGNLEFDNNTIISANCIEKSLPIYIESVHKEETAQLNELFTDSPFESNKDFDYFHRLKVCFQLHCYDGAQMLAAALGYAKVADAIEYPFFKNAVQQIIRDAAEILRIQFPKMAERLSHTRTELEKLIFDPSNKDLTSRNCRLGLTKICPGERFLQPLLDAECFGGGLKSTALIIAATLIVSDCVWHHLNGSDTARKYQYFLSTIRNSDYSDSLPIDKAIAQLSLSAPQYEAINLAVEEIRHAN